MQKVIQRTKTAARRAAARTEKQIDHVEKGHAWARAESAKRLNRYNVSLIKNARARQREEWLRGPLAPRPDVGEVAETYGAMPIYNFQVPDKHPKNRVKWSGLMAGDRVVVVRGREKGRIGEVRDVREEKGTVEINGVNLAEVTVPEWIQQEDQEQQDLMTVPVGVPMGDVRLVVALPHPQTGVLRDVVVERVECVRREWDEKAGRRGRGMRVVAGTRTVIPWPSESEPEYEDYESDTLRASVEDVTFVPTLQVPPIPEGVIDELRNKYSKFRTRHDWEFVQRKEAEDARGEKRQDLAKTMRTPVQEAADLRAKERAVREKDLTEEQLAKIGAVIAGERAKVAQTLRQVEQ